jgi:NADH-quinone oxidoreductase subunit E
MNNPRNGAARTAEKFAFSDDAVAKVEAILARYPEGRQASAVIDLLHLAQRQAGGWLPRAAIETVAGILDMAPARVYEVATFYSMFNHHPVGRHQIRVCTTTPCWLRGSDSIVNACKSKLGISMGETTEDGTFTLTESECLGACVNAPVVHIDDAYYEDLDETRMVALLEAFERGETPSPGSQTGRQGSMSLKNSAALSTTTAKAEK